MLSALLPGVRELRTPLITGFLWALCFWFPFGSKITESGSTNKFVSQFRLDVVPSPIWFAVGGVATYLLGSLLVCHTSPFSLVSNRIRPRLRPVVVRLDLDQQPSLRRYKRIWKFWQHFGYRWRPLYLFRNWTEERPARSIIDGWIGDKFYSFVDDGKVPVMRGAGREDTEIPGFEAFYTVESVLKTHHGQDEILETFLYFFSRDIKDEQSSIETRIQMQFPEVYIEIDRLKVEGELRLSIFWPLTILALLLAWFWVPLALAILVVPPILLRDGYRRVRQASDKTWNIVIATDIGSPVLDDLRDAIGQDPGDFAKREYPNDAF
jgi:hypothetical protein